MEDYVVVTFATKGDNDKYFTWGKTFELNMQVLDIPYDIEYIDPLPIQKPKFRKKATTRLRGMFMYDKLFEHSKTVIWMDCDDGFLSKPAIPDSDFDVGFLKNVLPSKKKLPITAGTIVVKPTDAGFHFLKVWDYLNSWPGLDPVGGSHVRLCYARKILQGTESGDPWRFKEADLTGCFNIKYNMNRRKRVMQKEAYLDCLNSIREEQGLPSIG